MPTWWARLETVRTARPGILCMITGYLTAVSNLLRSPRPAGLSGQRSRERAGPCFTSTSISAGGRLQALALATTALSQGPGFVQAGTDLLRSKSFDGNSYDNGDWSNAIHWDCRAGNGLGRGLPLAADNQGQWVYAKPLLASPALVPGCRGITDTTAQYSSSCRSSAPARCSQ